MQYFSDKGAWIPGSEMKCGSWWKLSQPNITGGAILKNSQSKQLIGAKLVVWTYRNSKKNSECSNDFEFWLKIIIRESITQNLISLFLSLFGSILYYQLLYNFYYTSHTIYNIYVIPLMYVNQPRFHSFAYFRQIVAVCEKLTLSGSDSAS